MIMWVVIVQNRNLVFAVKRCMIQLFAITKRVSEAILQLSIVPQIMHPTFLLFLYEPPRFFWKIQNPLNKHEVRITALFDQDSRRPYVTQKVKNILQLAPICTERISISTSRNKECKSKNLEKVYVHLKNFKEKFELEALCTPFICLQFRDSQAILLSKILII